MVDRVLDPRPLVGAGELDAEAGPQPVSGASTRQRGEIALAGAKVARRVEAEIGVVRVRRVADQDAVLKHAHEIVAEIELEQAVAEQRMLGGQRETPSCAAAADFSFPPLTWLVDRLAALMKS